MRPEVSLGHPVTRSKREECFGEGKVIEGAKLNKALAVLIELADAKVDNEVAPGVMI
jgi:hypothetical protein